MTLPSPVPPRRPVAVPALLTLLALLVPNTPARAAGSGILGVEVGLQYASGSVGDSAGVTVTARNIDTGATIVLDAYSPGYFQSLGVPFGRYTVSAQKPGFAVRHWPGQYHAASAQTIEFGQAAGCDPGAATMCDIHTLAIELQESVTLTGTVRDRAGRPVPDAEVTAVRADEPLFAPAQRVGADGRFTLALPLGGYSVGTPNGQRRAGADVELSSQTVRDLVLLDPPGPPRGVEAAAGNRQARVSWLPPLDDGGTAVTGYTVTATPGGASCAGTSSCTLSGLDNGREYSVSVRAHNAVGAGESSAQAATPTAGVPEPPSDVRVTAGDRSVEATWSASPSDAVIEYTAVAAPGGRSCSTAGLSCVIPGLRNGRGYRVSVTARSQAGASAQSEPSRRVRPSTQPSAPRGVRTTPGKGRLRVRWAAPRRDGGRAVRRYVATAWPGGRTCSTRGGLRCTIRRLDPGSAYSVTVRASNAAGEGPSSPGTAPVRPLPGPSAPPKVRGLRVGFEGARAVVRWRPAERTTGYWVRLREAGGAYGPWTMTRTTRTAFVVGRGRHTVQVRPVGPGGKGPLSSRGFTRA